MLSSRVKLSKSVQLLLILVILFLAPSFLGEEGWTITHILPLLLLISLISIIREFYAHTTLYYRLVTIAVIGYVLDNIGDLVVFSEVQQRGLDLISNLIYLCFYLAAILLIIGKLYSEKKVTWDTIIGAISVYLLLGLFWFLLYRTVYILDVNAFSKSPVSAFQMLYFSFTTLTTLGYGDITPTSKMSMTLSNTQAIIGQLYPAIFLARLIGLYTAQVAREE